MAIVSSVIAAQNLQKDGRSYVHEQHTDNLGLVLDVTYLAPVGADLAANLAAHAVDLGANQTAAEIAANVTGAMSLGSAFTATLHYSTAAANFAALRAAYATATQTQAIMTGDFLASLTDGQLQTAFGLTAGQVTTLRTNKLTPAASAAATIRAAVGA